MLATQVAYWQLQETKRHNVATETETNRHNVDTEKLGWATLSETIRHNQETEAISWYNAREIKRHNIATEGIAMEQNAIGWANAGSNHLQAIAALENAQTNRMNAFTNMRNADIYEYATTVNAFNAAEANRIAEQSNEINAVKIANEFELGWNSMLVSRANVELRSQELQLARDRLNFDISMGVWRNVLETGESSIKGYTMMGGPTGAAE